MGVGDEERGGDGGCGWCVRACGEGVCRQKVRCWWRFDESSHALAKLGMQGGRHWCALLPRVHHEGRTVPLHWWQGMCIRPGHAKPCQAKPGQASELVRM